MTLPRPTLKALKSLPIESFRDSTQRGDIRQVWLTSDPDERLRLIKSLELTGLDNALLEDARSYYVQGRRPERHTTGSNIAKRPVYEVRDTTGAGWRGAIVEDKEGVPWLIFADRHDHFHSSLPTYLRKAEWEPTVLDQELKEQEDRGQEYRQWRVRLLTAVCDGLRDAVLDGSATLATPRTLAGRSTGLQIESALEDSSGDPFQTHNEDGLIDLSIVVSGPRDTLAQEIVRCIPAIQPDKTLWDAAYLPDGRLQVAITLTNAQLIQLVHDVLVDASNPPTVAPPPTHLHWVNAQAHAEGVFYRKAVRGLCGDWFVPRKDGSARLPICPECEKTEPLARRFLESLGE